MHSVTASSQHRAAAAAAAAAKPAATEAPIDTQVRVAAARGAMSGESRACVLSWLQASVTSCAALRPPARSQNVLGIILGGGAGTRLYPLTKKRAKPAVPLVRSCCIFSGRSAALSPRTSRARRTGAGLCGHTVVRRRLLRAARLPWKRVWTAVASWRRSRLPRLQGANYRLIDIPVSNCINSDINKIYCLTQFNSASLNRHLSNAYVRRRARSARPRWLVTDPLSQNANIGSYTRQGFVEVLAAQQSPENPDWFQGTADAVRQYLWLFKVRAPPQRVAGRAHS